jgi:outer membrane protein assembly factor BamB
VAVAGLVAVGCFQRSAPLAVPVAEAAEPVAASNGDSMYGGTPQRNMVNLRDKNIPTEWKVKDPTKNVKWTAQLGNISYGGPTVAGGKVFVGTNNENPRNPKIKGDMGILMCFDAKDGKFLWQAIHEKLENTNENDFAKQGIASTPAVDGNRVYYVSNRCELVCADVEPKKGTTEANILWTYDMIKELGVFPRYLATSSPLIAGDVVFVVTGNGVDEKYKLPAPKAASFVAVDKKTGKIKWHKSYPGDKVMDGQWTNAAYAVVKGKPQVIFPGGDGWLYGLDAANGEIIWKFDCNPKKAVFKPSGRGDKAYFLATPVVYEDRVYIGLGLNPEDGGGAGHLWCIDITKTGDVSPVEDNFDPKAPANKNSAVIWHVGGKAAAAAGRDHAFGRTLSTCAIHDGLCYAADLDGFFYCFDAKTGKLYWDHDLKAELWSSPYWVDGKIYVGTNDSEVHVFAHGKEKKLLATNEVEHQVKSPVVVANGILYVMTDSVLFAISGK